MRKGKYKIELGGQEFEYEVRNSLRSRNLRVTISGEGELLISAPALVSRFFVESFLKERGEWIIKHMKKILNNQNIRIPDDPRRYRDFKERARGLVKDRLAYFNQFYGFQYGTVAIRNQQSRWGSCSSKGNLNFNYRIVFLPSDESDYIVVHELCHLKEMNHSSRFWELVELTVPDYREIRKKLKSKSLTSV